MTKTYPEIFNKQEIDAVITASEEDDFAYVLFYIAKYTGRRLGEYYDVRVRDIDFEKGIMMTKVLKRRKKVEKEAILTPECLQLLRKYIKKEGLGLEDYIFRKVKYRQIQNLAKKYAQKAGLTKNFSFHNFRHFFITELSKQGWSYDKIAKLTGHSSVGTLACYDHTVATDIKDKALDALREF